MIELGTATDLSAEVAREKVETVRALVSDAWAEVADLYRGRAWLALGYTSWDALCDAEFEGARIRLPREERREVVGSLREAGLSTRAIGAALGVDQKTVVNDLAGEEKSSPAAAPITGTDGKSYAPTRPALIREATERAEPVVPRPAPSPPLSSEGAEQASPSRRPRTDVLGQVEQVLMHARRAVQSAEPLERGHFTNRKDEAARWAGGLSTHVQALQRLLDTLQEASQ